MTSPYSNSNSTPVTKTPSHIEDLTDRRFGRWIVLGFSHIDEKRSSNWVVRCDCGTEKPIQRGQLIRGISQSCGCRFEEMRKNGMRHTHGLTKSPLYFCWYAMIVRCHKTTDPMFAYYGERGITVCDRWRFGEDGKHGLQCFLDDMGERPSPEHTIDRFPNNGGNYEPGNCRWATHLQQINNRSNTSSITFDGKTMSLGDWGRHLGFHWRLLYSRLRAGWPVERAFTEPVGHYRHKLTN